MASSNTSSTISAIIPAGLEHLTDRYSDFALIGEGGHALVYKAQDKSLLKVVAIKVLHSRSISQEQVVRFQQEAKVLCKLKHRGLVTVLNFGTSPEGIPYLVLDYTDGCPLNEICNAGSTREALKLFVQICEAMEHAHKQGVTHRDLKPSNILVDSTDHGLKVKILDFGIARVSEQSNPLGSNEIEGSPPYMSPEQIQGADVGRQSDIYSLGCVMFEALSGEPPYITDNAISTMTMHCKNAIPSLVNRSNGRTSPELSRIVTTCLAKRPEDRYRSMADLQKELEREIAVLMIQPEKQVETPLIAPCNNSKTWRVPATITASVVMLATPLFCLIPGADHVLPFLKSGDTASHTVALAKSEPKQRPSKLRFEQHAGDTGRCWKQKAVDADPLFGSPIDDDAVMMLKGREPLDLYLDNSKVKGHGVGALSDWPIHSINLNFSSVTDAGMKDICKIRTLRKVSLNMTDLSDKGIMELASLKNLDTLRLGSCPKITNKGIIHILKNCKRLTALNIGYSKRLTAELIPVISSCPDLVRIELQGLGVNDKHVEMLCKNKAIIKLRLTHNPALTDKSVEQLATLPRLGSMSVSGCDNVSETAIERFRKLHPHCEIVKEFKKKKERKVEDFVSDLLQAELGS